jgi:hypothetical protein
MPGARPGGSIDPVDLAQAMEVLMRARSITDLRSCRGLTSESGMTTAEYAVGTVAACGFGGILYKLLTSDTVVTLLKDIIKRALTLSF